MVTPTQLRAVCEVVKEGSFAAAGRKLGYTSSAVSQQIAALERAIGITLFERAAHGIHATPAAAFIAARGEELLMRIEDFDAQLGQLAGGAHGRLRLGSFPTANSRIIPDVLAGIMRAHPDAEVELDEGNTDRLVTGVVEGDLDLVVVHVYALVPERWPAGLTDVELMNEDLLLVLPADHPRAGAADLRLADLRADRWISSQDGTAAGRCLRRVCATQGFEPTVAFRSDDYDVVQGLVRGGAGVAIVPEMGFTPEPGVYAVPLEWSPGRRISALYRTANTNPLLGTGLGVLRDVCGTYRAAQGSSAS